MSFCDFFEIAKDNFLGSPASPGEPRLTFVSQTRATARVVWETCLRWLRRRRLVSAREGLADASPSGSRLKNFRFAKIFVCSLRLRPSASPCSFMKSGEPGARRISLLTKMSVLTS